MHDGKFSRSLRLRATSFARNYREKLLQNYEKSARFSASERNNRANFARNRDRIARRNLENSEQNHKAFATAGFTIIEVALVLAIAGLIFLVVFLALPALQRSQRDQERKTDVGMAVAAIQQYYADGGDGASIPANPSCVANGFPECGPDKFANISAPLGPYLVSAGISSNIAGVKIWPLGTMDCSKINVFGGIGWMEIFVGCKCAKKQSSGHYSLDPGARFDAAVALPLESGSGSGTATLNSYCATASR